MTKAFLATFPELLELLFVYLEPKLFILHLSPAMASAAKPLRPALSFSDALFTHGTTALSQKRSGVPKSENGGVRNMKEGYQAFSKSPVWFKLAFLVARQRRWGRIWEGLTGKRNPELVLKPLSRGKRHSGLKQRGNIEWHIYLCFAFFQMRFKEELDLCCVCIDYNIHIKPLAYI